METREGKEKGKVRHMEENEEEGDERGKGERASGRESELE